MRLLRAKSAYVSMLLVIVMILMAAPVQTASAAMIGTDVITSSAQVDDARNYVQTVLSRQDIQDELIAMGINPAEAMQRVEAMSDTEVVAMAEQIQDAPAGGIIGTIIGVGILVGLVLLVTDILGYTDVYTFID